jgi:hypothetical protein
MAEWSGINVNDKFTLYVDKTSISINGKIARMWTMNDFKLPQHHKLENKTYLSSVGYREFDCANKMDNTLSVTFYSENIGAGSVVSSSKYDVKDWNYIPPNTVSEVSWNIACGKK